VRRTAVPLLLPLLLVGCGGGSTSEGTQAGGGTLRAVLARPGPEIALIQGTSDYAAGPVRVSFLVIRSNGQAVSSPNAKVWVGTRLDGPVLATAEATLEPIGVPGVSAPASGDVTKIYVVKLQLPRPGKYTLVAQPAGEQLQGVANLDVRKHTQAPGVGDRAIASRTPTIASTHGNLAALTTAKPPDVALLRYSVADSLAAHKPFVLVFATPKFCTSRTCGPIVDVVEAVQKRSAARGLRFIHVEIYKDLNPGAGFNRWVREWRLPTEPFIFLVGSDGLIKARFEGSVSVEELADAVKATLS
jgi:hypothetical protein